MPVLGPGGWVQIKTYHPDVYKGEGDPELMTRRLVAAYEVSVWEFLCAGY